MKKLYLIVVAICVVSNTVGSESDVEYDVEYDIDPYDSEEDMRRIMFPDRSHETEEERFQRESDWWKSFCRYNEDYPFNNYDLQPTETKLRTMVTGDPIAIGAMDIFLSSFYWKFVDYCVENLPAITEPNQQRFREVLILLAPGLVSTRYMARAVSAVGRKQDDVRAEDIRYLPFCLDMFFYAAVRNGQLGRRVLSEMCIDAFYASCLGRGQDELFRVYDIEDASLMGRLFEDSGLHYLPKSIWPNWN